MRVCSDFLRISLHSRLDWGGISGGVSGAGRPRDRLLSVPRATPATPATPSLRNIEEGSSPAARPPGSRARFPDERGGGVSQKKKNRKGSVWNGYPFSLAWKTRQQVSRQIFLGNHFLLMWAGARNRSRINCRHSPPARPLSTPTVGMMNAGTITRSARGSRPSPSAPPSLG